MTRALMPLTKRENKMRLLCFELTMPGVASWNSRWSGEGRCYAKIKNVSKPNEKPFFPTKDNPTSFDFRWKDGWWARVSCRQVTSKEAEKIRKISDGFCGYDWMIDSILKHGKIVDNDTVSND